MTNEEKADEIAFNHKMTHLELENDGSVYDVDSYDECLASAMEMAKWKEQQMIENACEWLISNANDYIINDKQDGGRDWLKIKSEMFDDFKKAMKE